MIKYRIQFPALELEEERRADAEDPAKIRCVAEYPERWLAEIALAKFKLTITDLHIEAFDTKTGETVEDNNEED